VLCAVEVFDWDLDPERVGELVSVFDIIELIEYVGV
jgi:hypothetical protein